MEQHTSRSSTPPRPPAQLFCCRQVFTVKKNNIPPFHPLHQILAHVLSPGTFENDDLPLPSPADPQTTSSTAEEAQETIPGPNECVIIVMSDPQRRQDGSFNATASGSRMFCGRMEDGKWLWREKVEARNNTAGVLAEVSGIGKERLRKEMTGCQCEEHGWTYTMVVLIGVNEQKEPEESEKGRDDGNGEREMLLRMVAEAGTRAGAREGAPEVPAQCNPQ